MVYYFMVEILGPDNGGWDDFYGFLTRIPSWISLLSFMPLTFAVASLLRVLHNRSSLRLKRQEAYYIREYGGQNVRERIVSTAERQASGKKPDNIVIPLWLLEALTQNDNGVSTEEACRLYLDAVLRQAKDSWLWE